MNRWHSRLKSLKAVPCSFTVVSLRCCYSLFNAFCLNPMSEKTSVKMCLIYSPRVFIFSFLIQWMIFVWSSIIALIIFFNKIVVSRYPNLKLLGNVFGVDIRCSLSKIIWDKTFYIITASYLRVFVFFIASLKPTFLLYFCCLFAIKFFRVRLL